MLLTLRITGNWGELKKIKIAVCLRETNGFITNSDVRKMLGVSGATAKHYMADFVRQGILESESSVNQRFLTWMSTYFKLKGISIVSEEDINRKIFSRK